MAAITHTTSRKKPSGAIVFGGVALGVAILAAVLAGWAPIQFSIVTVFLFAGPHNWYEFRYFLSRMPARWGPRKYFYGLGIAGALLLTAVIILIHLLSSWSGVENDVRQAFVSAWVTAFVLWIATLIWMRGRERRGRDWSWIWAVACFVIAAAWIFPQQWYMGLVYLHPLIAICYLQRELRRHRPRWLPAFYAVLCCVPLLIGVLYWRLAHAADLPVEDDLSWRISQHAGAGVFAGVSSHFLVATHTFLEMLHYAIWLGVIPLLTVGARPWEKIESTPIAKKSIHWRWAVRCVVFGGAAAVLLLWGSFSLDYTTTRDIYFTVAMVHVLAEFPFLIGTV